MQLTRTATLVLSVVTIPIGVTPPILAQGASLTPFHTVQGHQAGGGTGTAVAGMGDVTGDGIPDFAVGSRNASSGNVRAYSGATRQLLWEFHDGGTIFKAGSTLAAIPDSNSDGLPDLIVGAPAIAHVNVKGHVLVLSGADGSVIRDVMSNSGFERFGEAVASVGDVNGDGTPDFLGGGPGATNAFGGISRLLSGANGSVIHQYGGFLDENFGHAVAGLGDTNGDGVPDYAVGAPGTDVKSQNEGLVTIFSGASGDPIRFVPGKVQNDHAGYRLANAGRMDGDAVDDLLVGAIFAKGVGGSNSGNSWVISGAKTKTLKIFPGSAASERVGSALANLGDVSGDGIPDYAVGASGFAPGGRVYVVSGASGLPLAHYDAPAQFEALGDSVAGVGDVDGDGVNDLLVGAWSADSNGLVTAGEARLLSLAGLFEPPKKPLKRKTALQRDPGSPDADALGTLEISIVKSTQTVLLKVSKLDPAFATEYRVFLVDVPGGSVDHDLGPLVLKSAKSGTWELKLVGEGAAPGALGVNHLTQLDGWRVEIRDQDGTVHLGCEALALLTPLTNTTIKGAFPGPNGSVLAAQLKFSAATGSSQITLSVTKLDKAIDPATLSLWIEEAVASNTFVRVGPLVKGKLVIDTKKGDALPLGAATVLDLSLLRVQLRAGADVLIEGAIP